MIVTILDKNRNVVAMYPEEYVKEITIEFDNGMKFEFKMTNRGNLRVATSTGNPLVVNPQSSNCITLREAL